MIPHQGLGIEHREHYSRFWDIRAICGQIENPLTPAIIAQWESHQGFRFSKWERDAYLRMDAAFRRSHSAVVSWHMKRAKVKEDPDKGRMHGRRNPSL